MIPGVEIMEQLLNRKITSLNLGTKVILNLGSWRKTHNGFSQIARVTITEWLIKHQKKSPENTFMINWL